MTQATVGGVVVGLESPIVLLAVPVAVALLWALVLRRSEGSASRRSRWLLFASRVLVAVLLVGAAAGPYTVVTRETPGDPQVNLLVDRSDSMGVSPQVGDLEERIEAEGVPASVSVIGEGTRSRVGDGIAANLREDGSVVVVSDGQVTDGRSVGEATDLARSLNATISAVSLPPGDTERYVTLAGPGKTSVGVETTFLASVEGVNVERGTPRLTVTVDGEEVASQTLQDGSGAVEFSHTFEATGDHRVVATVESDDRYAVNDVFRKTVRAVERPRILYVSKGEYPLRDYLENVYDVDTASEVPANLDPYYAVVVQDVPASGIGDVDALQEFVIDGNGLFVVGGRNAFESGGYEDSSFASMLPVTVGEAGAGVTDLVIAIDVSGSAGEGMTVQKAIALDVLNQLGDENVVGVVGFNYQAYRVAEMAPLSQNRALLEDRIRRLQAGGATDIASGLRGAEEMLGRRSGTVILISDGRDEAAEPSAVAARLGADGKRVVAVGVGQGTNEATMRRIAAASGGSYFRATDTDRLRLLFGGASRQFRADRLTIVDQNAFITAGVTLTANPGQANDVAVRSGADYLVASGDGTPALASWRYGLGRVVTLTAYGPNGDLDGLLQRPDSLLLTKSVNYVVGDPERKQAQSVTVGDARVGEPTPVVVRGERPEGGNLTFQAIGEGTYRAEVTPRTPGFETVLGTTYAVNYPTEYSRFGPSPAIDAAVRETGGRQFGPNQAAQIASFARQQSRGVREVRETWDWLLVLAGLLLFFVEVAVRRLQVYQGRTRLESGLP